GNYESLGTLKEKFHSLIQMPFKNQIERFKESLHYGRLHFFGKSQGINLEEKLLTLKPEMYFQNFPLLNWDDLEFFLIDHLKDFLKLIDIDSKLPLKMSLKGKREIPVH